MPRSRPARILLLQTNLDTDVGSRRSEIHFMREFLANFESVELEAAQVHSRADLEKFLGLARRRRYGTIHIVAHGAAQDREVDIILTNHEPVNLSRRENQRLLRGLKVDSLLLSCCFVGQNRPLMRTLMRESGASAVFGYRDAVTDYQAFLAEALFYHLVYGTTPKIPYREVAEILRFTLDYLRIDDDGGGLSDPLLVCESLERAK